MNGPRFSVTSCENGYTVKLEGPAWVFPDRRRLALWIENEMPEAPFERGEQTTTIPDLAPDPAYPHVR